MGYFKKGEFKMTERKIALITGGSRGIGFSCAKELAKAGCDIIINDICDIATAVDDKAEQVEIGIRPGEKLHEQMIGVEDAHFTYEYPEHYKILPQICNWGPFDAMIKGGTPVPEGFSYTSDNNKEWMTIPQLQEWIDKNKAKIGSI